MPPVKQLKEANQLDIVAAIQHHGGSKQVAASLQLRAGPRGKFATLESVVQAVQAFVQQYALGNDMPVARVFGRAGESHLMNSICRHGIRKVAEAAGLRYSRPVGP